MRWPSGVPGLRDRHRTPLNAPRIAGPRAAAIAGALAIALFVPAIGDAGKAQDGRYRGVSTNTAGGADKVKIRFRVAKGGNRIKNWKAKLIVHCPILFPPAQLIEVPMPTMKVKRNGRFRKSVRSEPGQPGRIKVRGKLVRKRVKRGRFSYQSRVCQRGVPDPIRWKARRVRR